MSGPEIHPYTPTSRHLKAVMWSLDAAEQEDRLTLSTEESTKIDVSKPSADAT